MPRRTNVELLVDSLMEFDRQQASANKLAVALDWDIEKVMRVVNAARSDSTRPVQVGPGGVIQYRGSERGKETGIYQDVARVIENYWAKKIGLREPHVTVTARGGRRRGEVWSHPDLVLSALPPRRRHRDDPPDLHSIEVETYSGFDIKSVYQAHAQGRGADYRWVFFATAPKVNPPLDRIQWAAAELNIGLVQFDRAGASTTYKVHSRPQWERPSPEDRKIFCDTVGVIS